MVTKEQSIDFLLKYFPDFQIYWQQHLAYWEGESPGYSLDIAEFSHYVIDLLKADEKDNELLAKIFNFVEKMLIEGDESVQNAFATCFLEHLINATSCENDGISAASFLHFLGEESKAYCKAWDKFTGVKTKGLWD